MEQCTLPATVLWPGGKTRAHSIPILKERARPTGLHQEEAPFPESPTDTQQHGEEKRPQSKRVDEAKKEKAVAHKALTTQAGEEAKCSSHPPLERNWASGLRWGRQLSGSPA